ncbi:transposase [Pseudoalteromonas viridis]|uniref:Transposase n=1 Tax=Pseudoalteromonas viridis TaxID=339617 RepID=A0ABX7VEK6_9GAMM|nr:transposase [Pseudoalteromonas viridis]
MDNNRAERAIKPFVIGRKSWLFSFTISGAESSAILYNVIDTARANGHTPFDV